MQALGTKQQLHLTTCRDHRRPFSTNSFMFKPPAALGNSLAQLRLLPPAAATTDDDLDTEYNDPQGQPLTADTSTSYSPPDDNDDSQSLATGIAKVCWETKGEDLMVLHVAPLVYWTRYMVLVTVFSRPQLNAILAKVEKEAFEVFGRRPASPASGKSAWELLDYGDVVVHVMTADQREYYDLESFYGAADELDLPFMAGGQSQTPAWETKL